MNNVDTGTSKTLKQRIWNLLDVCDFVLEDAAKRMEISQHNLCRYLYKYNAMSDVEEHRKQRVLDQECGRNIIKIGDYVQWVSQGAMRFSEPKQITGYSPDGDWVFIEAEQCAFPVEEIVLSEKESK